MFFSCCALFSADDDAGSDTENLKGFEEIEVPPDHTLDLSISTEADGNAVWSRSMGSTPPSSLQPTEEASSVMTADEIGDPLLHNQRLAASAEGVSQRARGVAKACAVSAEKTRAAAPSEADRASIDRVHQTLRALREAEDAAHAAAEEAEKRRFEEEASARAARQAESEARKALWLAQEAQKAKLEADRRAIEHQVAEEDVFQQQADEKRHQAEEHIISLLSSSKGLRLLKHGRNGRTTTKILNIDHTHQTLTWGTAVYHLSQMQTVRKGIEADPTHPGFTGTLDLRRAKKAKQKLGCSFSLIFPERSLDFTASTREECEKLVTGFRALVHRYRASSR